MQFNSIEFLLYLPIVFLLYWSLHKSIKIQNAFIVLVSYVFYGWWNVRLLFLIALTSLLSYLSGVYIEKIGTAEKPIRFITQKSIHYHSIVTQASLHSHSSITPESLQSHSIVTPYSLPSHYMSLHLLLHSC